MAITLVCQRSARRRCGWLVAQGGHDKDRGGARPLRAPPGV